MTDTPTAKKAASARKLAAAPPPGDDGPLTPDQACRVACLSTARALLDREVTARELLDLANYIEIGLLPYQVSERPMLVQSLYGPSDIPHPEEPTLTWAGTTTLTNTHEGEDQ